MKNGKYIFYIYIIVLITFITHEYTLYGLIIKNQFHNIVPMYNIIYIFIL